MPKPMDMDEHRNGWARISKKTARGLYGCGLPVYVLPLSLTGDIGIYHPVEIRYDPDATFDDLAQQAAAGWASLGHPGQSAWLMDAATRLTIQIEFADGSNPWVFFGTAGYCYGSLRKWTRRYDLEPRPSGSPSVKRYRAAEKHAGDQAQAGEHDPENPLF